MVNRMRIRSRRTCRSAAARVAARRGGGACRHAQRGVVAVEFALVFLFGVLPLLLLTLSGVLIFAAKQSLTLAAANGARAALRYGSDGSLAGREAAACAAAAQSMDWLLNFSGASQTCPTPLIAVTAIPCPSAASVQCVQVSATFDYDAHPFIPGTATVYGWVLGKDLSSSALVQLDATGD